MPYLSSVYLYIQIVVLVAIAISALRKKKERNLLTLVTIGTILVLVHGQAIWFMQKFEVDEIFSIVHLFQKISFSAISSSIQLLILFTFSFVLGSFSFFFDDFSSFPHNPRKEISPFSYFLICSWVSINCSFLVYLLGGIFMALAQPGQSIGGQTMLLIAISLGKFPLFYKLSQRQAVKSIDILLFAITFLLTLFNSRFLASFILIQLLLIYNYAVREVPRKIMAYAAFALVFIFIGYGLYRDNAALNPDLTASERIFAAIERMTSDENPINWFYRTNVEGFAGLAGLLTHIEENGPITHDLGLSNLTLFTQLIPNGLRNNPNLPFGTLASYFSSFYPYTGSVVPSGLENAYAHFGIFGILGLGILLGYLTRYLHWQLRLPTSNRLLWALLSVQVFNLIRGTFRNALFFGLADFVMCNLFMFILSLKFAHYKLHIPLRLKPKP